VIQRAGIGMQSRQQLIYRGGAQPTGPFIARSDALELLSALTGIQKTSFADGFL
jgi:hypothetical protein